MRIALDFDWPLCNSHEVWIKLYREEYKERKLPKSIDFDTYDLTKVFDLTDDEKNTLLDKTRLEEHLKYAAPSDSNFYVFLNRLRKEGHELFVLTKNPEYSKMLIQYWLSKYGLGDISIESVENISDKKDYKFDLLIDDSPEAYQMLDWSIDDRNLLLYNAPWNKDLEEKQGVMRVYNFKEVYDIINQIEPHIPAWEEL